MQNNTFFEDSDPNSIIVFEELPSTNDYLKELLSKFKPLEQFTVIMAKNQTAGKGQRGNTWNSEPDSNLTASFLISPEKLEISNQFSLTVLASLAVYDTLKTLGFQKLSIKWPNDIMIENKKVAGILIENKIAGTYINHSIIGIGINVYQKQFPKDISAKTSSLILEKQDFNIEILQIVKIIQKKLAEYSAFYLQNIEESLIRYNRKLFRKDESHTYLFEGNMVEATILGVEGDGLLKIEIDKNPYKIDLKGISYIL
ncbi:biotin--[acetyl-CoA-carboxylase] ligase [Sphingobacterium composti Ten et al. 2007 non Yoo et al. 2007]|uniref:biotin--[acetyl-CoA-carboxylase] ligase n=1 Tax=Sphingobacterium composti TaxID=363260 RepID=UPI00135C9553|nr:biotin--[acetyl-CoA-carboxylase] ligase [Sphingobacterium composti Ten et al. 2007 non Yoo et al. 2007]